DIPRKTLHSSIGFLTLYLYASNGNPRNVVLALSLALAVIVPCNILRLRSLRFELWFERGVGFLMRESEKEHTDGVIWYCTSSASSSSSPYTPSILPPSPSSYCRGLIPPRLP
ncbi:hypothetical protein BV20DRAFT_1107531, partial [Pilatotrama ljubarskyi]